MRSPFTGLQVRESTDTGWFRLKPALRVTFPWLQQVLTRCRLSEDACFDSLSDAAVPFTGIRAVRQASLGH